MVETGAVAVEVMYNPRLLASIHRALSVDEPGPVYGGSSKVEVREFRRRLKVGKSETPTLAPTLVLAP